MTANERCERYRLRHREELNAKKRAYYQLNKDKEHIRRMIYINAHREELRAKGRISDAKPERRARRKQLEQTEIRKATRRAWKQNNEAQFKAYQTKYEKSYRQRRKELHDKKQIKDVQYRLRRTLRANLKNAIKNYRQKGSAIDNLGCSIDELRKHLESQWLSEMNWNNFGRLNKANDTWQIDHIRPLSSFDLTDQKQIAVACHYTNLAPLWALDNRRKGNKVLKQIGGVKCPHVGPVFVALGA